MVNGSFVAADELPGLLVPMRMNVFGTRTVLKRRKPVEVGVGWQGWNASPTMEQRMARLPGSGSFYWHGAIQAVTAAKSMMTADPTIHQIAIETISGRPVGRLYRGN